MDLRGKRVFVTGAGGFIASHLVERLLADGASVKAEVMAHGRDKKIRIFKMKRRKKYRRMQGHRQAYTQLKVTEISA